MVAAIIVAAVPALAYGAGADTLVWTTQASRPTLLPYYPQTVRFVSEPVTVGGVDKLVVLGGTADVGEQFCSRGVSVYNTSTNTWLTGPLLPADVYAAGSVSDGTNIWIFGGQDAANPASLPRPVTNRVMRYNALTTNTTIESHAIVDARARASACIVGGVAYIVGGHDENAVTQDTIISYDLATGASQICQKTNGSQVQIPLGVRSPVVFAYNNEVYCFGGLGGVTSGWKWNPIDPDHFHTLAPELISRPGLRTKATGNGKVYLPGNPSQEYDIANDTWYFAPSKPNATGGAGDVVIDNDVWTIGGWTLPVQTTTAYLDKAQIVPTLASGSGSVSPGTSTQVSVGSGNTATVQFDSGASLGDLTVSEIGYGSLPSGMTDGFQVGTDPQVYDIVTNSTGWGTLTITLPYSGAASPASPPVVMHWNGLTWSPATIVNWSSTPQGQVTFTWSGALSPFSVGGPSASPAVSTPASAEWSLAVGIFAAIGATTWFRRARGSSTT